MKPTASASGATISAPATCRSGPLWKGLAERPVVGAFTATATGQVRRDIEEQLGLRSPLRLVTGFDRPNLRFETQRLTNSDKPHALVDLLLEAGDVPVIVYCSTVRQVEQTAQTLQGLGFAAAAYHGQLPAELRRRTQEDFLFDRVQVMVATNAFGHGHRQAQCADGGPLQYAPGPGELLPGGGAGGPGRGTCPLRAAVRSQRCAHRPVFHRQGGDGGHRASGPAPGECPAGPGTAAVHDLLRHHPAVPAGRTAALLWAEGARPLRQLLPAACSPKPSCRRPGPPRPRARPAAPAARAAGLGPGDQQLLAALYAVRKELARRDKLPAFTVCSDAALRQLCTRRPASMAQLLEIPGINEARAQRYGPALLDAVRRYG